MRTLLFLSLSVLIALPLHAQSQNETLFELNRKVEVVPDSVEEEAMALAKEKKYLREVTPAGDPTVLIAGDMQLRIGKTPFTLYLRSTNHHPEARLESQKIEVSEGARQKAEEFLQEVINRAASKHG